MQSLEFGKNLDFQSKNLLSGGFGAVPLEGLKFQENNNTTFKISPDFLADERAELEELKNSIPQVIRDTVAKLKTQFAYKKYWIDGNPAKFDGIEVNWTDAGKNSSVSGVTLCLRSLDGKGTLKTVLIPSDTGYTLSDSRITESKPLGIVRESTPVQQKKVRGVDQAAVKLEGAKSDIQRIDQMLRLQNNLLDISDNKQQFSGSNFDNIDFARIPQSDGEYFYYEKITEKGEESKTVKIQKTEGVRYKIYRVGTDGKTVLGIGELNGEKFTRIAGKIVNAERPDLRNAKINPKK